MGEPCPNAKSYTDLIETKEPKFFLKTRTFLLDHTSIFTYILRYPSSINKTMKKLSETLTELGIAFSFPIEIKDANDNVTYYEDSSGRWYRRDYDAHGKVTYHENYEGLWYKYERDAKGNETYHEDSDGYWYRYEFDANGNETYYENSFGDKRGTPRSAKTCEIDGIK